MIRVIVCSKHALFRKGLERLLKEAAGVEVVAEAQDVKQALQYLRETGADRLVLDCADSSTRPAEVAASLLNEGLAVGVIGLNLRDNVLLLFRGKRREVKGIADLVDSLRENDDEPKRCDAGDGGMGADGGEEGEYRATSQEMATLAENRSRVYAFLASVFNQLPDDEFAVRLKDGGLARQLESLAAQEDISADMVEGVRIVADFIRASQGRATEELRTALAVDRARLLRGIKPGYGPPPPYESVYVGSDRQPQMQATIDVVKAYAEAGVALSETAHDQPDFIGFELDFLRHLAESEARGWKARDESKALEALETEQEFLRVHAGRWIPRFCDLMAKEARLDFYRGIALITRGFITQELTGVAELLRQSQPQGFDAGSPSVQGVE